jgi:hypothetical protein
LREKAARQSHATGMSFPRIPLPQVFIWIATFQNLYLDYKELKEGFANSIRAFFIDKSANPMKRQVTGADNRAFLSLYGTTLPRVQRQNRGG